MSPRATFGMILMLGALIWCLASLARIFIGPHRKIALIRSGQSVFVFFVGAIVVGTFGGQQQGRTPTPTGDAARTRTETSTPPQPEPELTQFVPEPSSGASDQSPIAVPTVTARYQTSPTLVSLVVAGFNPAMVGAFALYWACVRNVHDVVSLGCECNLYLRRATRIDAVGSTLPL